MRVSRTCLAAGVCLVLSIISWSYEAVFYGDISADGVLQESFFLPLGFILLAAAAVLAAVCGVLRVFKRR